MSEHHNDHHSTEQKPVSFTVPFILACVTLLILVSFLSLCDPKKGHHGECEKECTEECAKDGKSCKHDMNAHKGEEKQAVESDEDPAPAEDVPVTEAEATEKVAEPAAAEKH